MILKFFSTPKGLLILILLLLAGLSAPAEGLRLAAPGMFAAVAVAAAIDFLILTRQRRRWTFPDGAILSGMFVAMVLSPHEPWHVPAATSAVAIISKHLFRTRSANIFNPAALGLVATFYLFNTGQSWWGALPELPPAALAVLLATGIFITGRVNKMPLVLAFLGTYFTLFTLTAFASDPRHVAEIFRAPDLHAALFFAFFILTDPPTSPVRYAGQVICGVIVAAAGYLFFELLGAAHYLLAGVLAGNIWEAWRRSRAYAGRKSIGFVRRPA